MSDTKIDDCVLVSQQITGLLDVNDPLGGKYYLEVSSPGLERKFFFKEQYLRYINCSIKVKYFNDLNRKLSIKGTLSEVTQKGLIIQNGDNHQKVPFSSIIQANLIM